MKTHIVYITLIAALVGALALTLTVRRPQNATRTTTRTDTIVIRDTIRETIPVPITRLLVRTDTVRLVTTDSTGTDAPKTDTVQVSVPIEQKIYETDDYRAVVEGFRPELKEMEIFRRTVHIDRETTISQKPKRWGVGIHAGYGLTLPEAKFRPYIGVGVQFSVFQW